MGSTKRGWSYSVGERGRNRVRAYEDNKTGIIMLEFYEDRPGGIEPTRRRVSLGHRDRNQAKQQADEAAAKLGRAEPLRPQGLTLQTLFESYLGEVTPQKSESKRGHDLRATKMFLRFFGPDRLAHTLNVRDWDRFTEARRRGLVAPSGNLKMAGVGNRQIAYDLTFLRATLNWATLAGNGGGDPLLARNPLKGLHLPEEKNPKRPLLPHGRYEAMLQVGKEVDWRFKAMLVLAWETGHRSNSLRHLQWEDVDLSTATVRWKAEYDKAGREHTTPLSAVALGALGAARTHNPGLGGTWMFPAPKNASCPCSRYLLTKWWKKAESRAGLDPVPRLGWQGCRRSFATDLKNTPTSDLLRLGGWKCVQTLQKCYQQPDMVTMRTALDGRVNAELGQNGNQPTVRTDSMGPEGANEEPRPDEQVQAGQ